MGEAEQTGADARRLPRHRLEKIAINRDDAIAMDPRERASDADRDRVVRRLREGCGQGQLSPDTFSERVESAFLARRRTQLRALVLDLPPASPDRLRMAWRGALTAVRSLRPAPRAEGPVLRLPSRDGPMDASLLLGRSPDCDFCLSEPTVSRRHAELRFEGGSWRLSDLDSFNGSYVNGLRVRRAPLAAGDTIGLGETLCVFELGGEALRWSG